MIGCAYKSGLEIWRKRSFRLRGGYANTEVRKRKVGYAKVKNKQKSLILKVNFPLNKAWEGHFKPIWRVQIPKNFLSAPTKVAPRVDTISMCHLFAKTSPALKNPGYAPVFRNDKI